MEKARHRLNTILRQHKRVSLSATIQEMRHRNCGASNLIKWAKSIWWFSLALYLLNYYHTELQGQVRKISNKIFK